MSEYSFNYSANVYNIFSSTIFLSKKSMFFLKGSCYMYIDLGT